MIKLEAFERSPRLSELKVSYRRERRAKSPSGDDQTIRSLTSATSYLRQIWNRDTIELYEDFVVLCLNNAHQPTGWVRISSGGYGFAVVDPKLIFGVALQTASSAILVAHNHPGGNLEPSREDRELTRRLAEGGELLSIRVLDHIILTSNSAISFRDKGLFPETRPYEPLMMRKEERSGGATSD